MRDNDSIILESLYKEQIGTEWSNMGEWVKFFSRPDITNYPVSYQVQTSDGIGKSLGSNVTFNYIINNAKKLLGSVSGDQNLLKRISDQLQDYFTGLNQSGIIDERRKDGLINMISDLGNTEKFVKSFGKLTSPEQPQNKIVKKYNQLSPDEKVKIENKLNEKMKEFVTNGWDKDLAFFKAVSSDFELMNAYRDSYTKSLEKISENFYRDMDDLQGYDDLIGVMAEIDPQKGREIINLYNQIKKFPRQKIGVNLDYDRSLMDLLLDFSNNMEKIASKAKL